MGSILKLVLYSPLLALQMLPDFLWLALIKLTGRRTSHRGVRYLRTHYRTIYFHMRYLGLKAYLPYADAIIASHERIIDGFSREIGASGSPLQYLGVLYPEFEERDVLDQLMVDKKLFIEITGSITRYRQKWIERINRQLISLGLQNVFGHCMSLPFSLLASDKPVDRGAYSLHPPQTRTWPYACSPTRIFRGLCSVDHNLSGIGRHHFSSKSD